MERKTVSRNGVEIFSYENPALHGFFISLFLRSGSMYESRDVSGITHFLEHALIRNVNRVMDMKLYETLDKYAVEFNASTYAEMVQFYISGASCNFGLAAEILPRLLSPIELTKDELDAERRRIKAEIRESDDKNSLSSFTNEIVYRNTPLASSILGTNKTVDKISRRKLEEYRKKSFTPENVFVYVTGSFLDSDIDKLKAEIEKYEIYSGDVHENYAPVPDDFGARAREIHIKNADFTMLRFSFDLDTSRVGVPESDLIYDILFSGYASRFFMEMSELRGIFYDINGALERYRNIGELYFSFELREAEIYEAVKISVDILNKMKSELLREDEIMRSAYVDNAYVLFDDAREFNFTFAYDTQIMKLPYRTLDDRIAAYKRVTPEAIRSAAREIFRPENLTFTMKGHKKKIDKERISALLSKLK